MSAAAFLRRLVKALDGAGVPHMVAGSFASTFHGMVRATQDVDVVVVLDRAGIRRLLAELPDDQWYASEEAALDAVRRGSQFNVLDMETGWKADVDYYSLELPDDDDDDWTGDDESAGIDAWSTHVDPSVPRY